jgi:hypothetical protein
VPPHGHLDCWLCVAVGAHLEMGQMVIVTIVAGDRRDSLWVAFSFLYFSMCTSNDSKEIPTSVMGRREKLLVRRVKPCSYYMTTGSGFHFWFSISTLRSHGYRDDGVVVARGCARLHRLSLEGHSGRTSLWQVLSEGTRIDSGWLPTSLCGGCATRAIRTRDQPHSYTPHGRTEVISSHILSPD